MQNYGPTSLLSGQSVVYTDDIRYSRSSSSNNKIRPVSWKPKARCVMYNLFFSLSPIEQEDFLWPHRIPTETQAHRQASKERFFFFLLAACPATVPPAHVFSANLAARKEGTISWMRQGETLLWLDPSCRFIKRTLEISRNFALRDHIKLAPLGYPYPSRTSHEFSIINIQFIYG